MRSISSIVENPTLTTPDKIRLMREILTCLGMSDETAKEAAEKELGRFPDAEWERVFPVRERIQCGAPEADILILGSSRNYFDNHPERRRCITPTS